MDALDPGGVLTAQVMVGLQQRPALQDVAGRDPALRQPALLQEHPQVPGVGPVGLGVPLAAAGEGGIGRLGDMRRDPGRGQLLGDVPPPGTSLQGERDVVAAGEPGQPGTQVRPVSRGDLAPPGLPGSGVEVVEGELLPVDIQSAYDGHRDLLKLHGARVSASRTRMLRSQYCASELGRSPSAGTSPRPAQPLTTSAGPMHVIFLVLRLGHVMIIP